MEALKPLKGHPLAFWFCGGDIIYRGASTHGAAHPYAISRDMAQSLRDLYQDDCGACLRAGDWRGAKIAARLYREVTHALDAHDEWKRLFARAA